MPQIQTHTNPALIEATRTRARIAGHVHRAQTMLVAAGLAALTIVGVAGAVMTTLI